jgi:hypothetical protein
VLAVFAAFVAFFRFKGFRNPFRIPEKSCDSSRAGGAGRSFRMLHAYPDQEFWSTEFLEPKRHQTCVAGLALEKIALFDKAPDHRPILVALSLLGEDEIGQR